MINEFWLSDPLGNRLTTVEPIAVDGVRVLNDYGTVKYLFDASFDDYIELDRIIEWWRGSDPGKLRLHQLIFIRGWELYTDSDGRNLTKVWGPDQNELLAHRIVAYAAGSAEASKTDYADDMMKAVVNENMIDAGSETFRVYPATNFTKQADLSDGPSITKAFSRKNVLEVLQDICDASATGGTDLYFDIVPSVLSDQSLTFEFRTYTGQRGVDHSSAAVDQVFFGPAYGNMFGASYSENWTEEANYIYAGGDGEGDARQVLTAYDSTRYTLSPWALRERFTDGRGLETAALQSKANEELDKGKPVKTFSGTLLSTPNTTYGVHWNFGDRVTAEYRGRQFDGIVKAVQISLGEGGRETITGVFEVD